MTNDKNMATDFRLPELGENIDSGVVVKVLVSVGETIAQEQPVVELETDKAAIEVPSSVSGIVKAIHVKEGEQASVGQVILTVGAEGADEHPALSERKPIRKTAEEPVGPEPVEKKEPPAKAKPEPLPATQEETPRTTPLRADRADQMRTTSDINVVPLVRRAEAQPRAHHEITPAAPSVRRLARELGVDIARVGGSGPAGQITMEDIKSHVRQVISGAQLRPTARKPVLAPLPEFERWGDVERKPMSNVRRKTAEHMSSAWTAIPHVTQYDKADITQLEELRKRYAKRAEAAGGKLTVTAIILKVAVAALKVFPQFNASLDMEANEIVYKKYYHIGVAVDTDRGLLVPVIRDVNKRNIVELSVELAQAAERARNKKTTLDELQGGTFTITNLGGIGGTSFSPIVNEPEVAILGVSRSSMEPAFVNGQFEPRLMLPLSLSYDHRLIDGADAARFLRWVVEALEQPLLLALEG